MSQVYWDGDFWYAALTTNPGYIPGSDPDVWRRIDIPYELLKPLALHAAASVFDNLGQAERALLLSRKAAAAADDIYLRSAFSGTGSFPIMK